jgi:hypothetical protein
VRFVRPLAAAVLLSTAAPVAAATNQVLLSEILGSWQGDDDVQFVELVLAVDGATDVSGASLTFASTGVGDRRSFQFIADVTNGDAGRRILLATTHGAQVMGIVPDFILPSGLLPPRTGRVCYQIPDLLGGTTLVDCLAYGGFTGSNGSFGVPLAIGPDDRSLERVSASGTNRVDWRGRLAPTPANNANALVTLASLCGDGTVDAGEECDGAPPRDTTCASLGFARGKLACTQCHVDASGCIACGNGAINGKEQCDGGDLGGRSCADLGFTGGALGCSAHCRLDTSTCDPTFFVPGGGPPRPECLATWRVTNAGQRPGGDGTAALRQRCRDGDAGCDSDATAGTCTFSVALCFDHEDARLGACQPSAIARWELLGQTSSPGLLDAVAALGPSVVDTGSVTFQPPLDASERCTPPVALVVPVRGKLALRTRATAASGMRDTDVLRLVCAP